MLELNGQTFFITRCHEFSEMFWAAKMGSMICTYHLFLISIWAVNSLVDGFISRDYIKLIWYQFTVSQYTYWTPVGLYKRYSAHIRIPTVFCRSPFHISQIIISCQMTSLNEEKREFLPEFVLSVFLRCGRSVGWFPNGFCTYMHTYTYMYIHIYIYNIYLYTV